MKDGAAMDSAAAAAVFWEKLQREYFALESDVGTSGREHHSILKDVPLQHKARTQGIPPEQRHWAWPTLLHARRQRLQRSGSGVQDYHELAQEQDIAMKDDTDVDSSTEEQRESIQQAQDLAMQRFSHLGPIEEDKIQRIMLAYAKSKDPFQYSHGMVEVCAVISTYLAEEDAFWALRLVLESLLPMYHDQSVVAFHVDCLVVHDLLRHYSPELSEHLVNIGVSVQLLCTKWFFSFMAESLPFDVVSRLFDVLILDSLQEGRQPKGKVLLSSSLAMFMYLKSALVEVEDASVAVDVLREFGLSTLEDPSVGNSFLDLVLYLHERLPDEDIADLRTKYEDQLKRESEDRQSGSSQTSKVKKSNSARDLLYMGKEKGKQLLIHWRSQTGLLDASEGPSSNANSEKQVLVRVQEEFHQIKRRRSRSGSLRSLSLRSKSSGKLDVLSSSGVRSDRKGREKEWIRLEKSRDPTQVAYQSRRGVPEEHRHWVWPILIQRTPCPANLEEAVDGMKDEGEQGELLDKEVVKSIEIDISRTKELQEDQAGRMRRVLRAFAIRNRRVGYCQGMNEILSVLIQHLDDKTALRSLILLIEGLMPAYHVDSMIGLHTDCAVLNTLLKQNDPELHGHLSELGLNMEILCTKWLVTCFLTSLPHYCGIQVIDMLLARTEEGQRASRVLLGVGICSFFAQREHLLEAKDSGEVLMAVNEYYAREMAKTREEMDGFLAFCYSVIEQLEPDVVDEFRSVHKDEVMERFAAFEAKKIEMRHQLEASKQRKHPHSTPPSPMMTEGGSHSARGANTSFFPSRPKKSSFSSYISKPLRAASKSTSSVPTDSRKEASYHQVDVMDASRSYAQELESMEEQLDDVGELFARGKIDDKEFACIKAQIVRKWCKTINSPRASLMRVREVKDDFRQVANKDGRGSLLVTSDLPFPAVEEEGVDRSRRKTGSTNSLYGRMKRAKKNAFAIIRSTFE